MKRMWYAVKKGEIQIFQEVGTIPGFTFSDKQIILS